MAKKKIEYTKEEQLAVKRSLIEEFKLKEKRVSQAWLDCIDCDPDPNNPNHWDFLLYSEEQNFYVNLKFFPRITIEPTHTTNYQIGIINYQKDMPVETILWYFHNILDRR